MGEGAPPKVLGTEPSGVTPNPLAEGFQPVLSPTVSGGSNVHCADIIRLSRAARSSSVPGARLKSPAEEAKLRMESVGCVSCTCARRRRWVSTRA